MVNAYMKLLFSFMFFPWMFLLSFSVESMDDFQKDFKNGVEYYTNKSEKDYLQKAITSLEKAAENDHVEAQFFLAELYNIEISIPDHKIKALDLMNKAAVNQHPSAPYKLYKYYLDGNKLEKAINWLNVAAKQEGKYFNVANVELALCYEKGIGVQIDSNKAFKIMEKTSYKDLNALYNLGRYYFNGIGVKVNLSKSIEIYLEAAQNGHILSQINLSIIYENGIGCNKNEKKAFEWLNKAVQLMVEKKQFVSVAIHALGNFYKEGIGIKKDLVKANQYFELAYSCGQLISLEEVVDYYYSKQDYIKLLEWLQKGEKDKNPYSIYMLGLLHFNGYSVIKDHELGMKYFVLASNMGSQEADIMLGEIYFNGIGGNKDLNRAIEYLSKAMNNGSALAKYKLALVFSYSKNEEDQHKSILFLKDLANEDYVPAILKLAYFYKIGFVLEKDVKKSITLYNRAGILGSSSAFYNLGMIYLNDTKDLTKAINYLIKSSEMKNANAFYALYQIFSNKNGKEYAEKSRIYLKEAAKLGHVDAIKIIKNIPRGDN